MRKMGRDFLGLYSRELDVQLDHVLQKMEELYYRNYTFDLLDSQSESERFYASQELYYKLENLIGYDSEIEAAIVLNEGNGVVVSVIDQTLMTQNALDERSLRALRENVIQVIYSHLSRKNISASGLFEDEELEKFSNNSIRSAMDMIRWVNYLYDALLEYERQQMEGHGLIDRIQLYVQEHYAEGITRNEIAEEFHLAPEYLSRMYKSQTGMALKSYINEYRIRQALLLLDDPECRINEVAGAVGFDNFSYFSTVFKKAVGISPTEYKKSKM